MGDKVQQFRDIFQERAVVAKLNAKQFQRLQRRARQAGLDPSEMVKKVVLDWLSKQPSSGGPPKSTGGN